MTRQWNVDDHQEAKNIADKLVDDRDLTDEEERKLKKKKKMKQARDEGSSRPIENVIVVRGIDDTFDFAEEGNVVLGADLKPTGDLQVTYQREGKVGDDYKMFATVFKDGEYEDYTLVLGPKEDDS